MRYVAVVFFLVGFAAGGALGSDIVGMAEGHPDREVLKDLEAYDLNVYLPAGVAPDDTVRAIQVDEHGYVICSKEVG